MYEDDTNIGKSPAMTFNRRDFLKSVGGGVVVLFTTQPRLVDAQENTAQNGVPAFNAYLRVGEDGRVTCFTGKIEMGQGVITSLPQMLADELDVAVDKIDMVMGDTDLCPFDRGTWGSLTTRVFGPELRAAGAQARSVLLYLASQQLGLPSAQLDVEDGVVFASADPGKRMAYAALTKGQEIISDVKVPAKVKTATEYNMMGTAQLRRDSHEKVTGKAVFTADIRLPGMLCARLVRPPSHTAILTSIDTSAAEAIEGVSVVRDDDLIAILHEKRDVADKAVSLVKTEYQVPDSDVDEDSIFDHLMGMAPEGEPMATGGDVKQGEASATSIIDETYRAAYVAHAPIEPHVALAHMENGKMTVWASTQSPFGLKGQLVSALGLAENKVRVITPFVGGGFGGKGSSKQGLQAARLARLSGKPVLVFWTREDEFYWDTFRPASIVKIRSGLNETGEPVFWDYRVYYAGSRGSALHYDIPNPVSYTHLTLPTTDGGG